MIKEEWYKEQITIGNAIEVAKGHYARYLEVKGDSPRTLRNNLLQLAQDIQARADKIEVT